MTTRYDVSTVKLQGGYVAKKCPVRAQNDVLRPVEPLPDSAVLERRFARGRAFEAEVMDALRALHPDALSVAEDVTATLAAMQQGAPLILSGRLPTDHVGRRNGKPDLLVADTDAMGYRPVDVKQHMTIEPGDTGIPLRSSSCAQPWLESAEFTDGFSARKKKEDLLQLAHYQTMLEAAGLAAPGGRFAGILGTEQKIVWYDLNEEIWRTPSSTGKQKLRSTMDIYQFEFDFRLDIMAVAQQHLADESVELLVVPVKIGECEECPWWDYCRPLLQAGSGDVSLIPGNGWREWKAHRDRGTFDRAGLAALDHPTARLIAAGVDVQTLIALAAAADPATSVDALGPFSKRPKQVANLLAVGVSTAGAATRLDASTATYERITSLPEQIDQARAALGPQPVYRRRGVTQIEVPRADVEVDVDMENVEDGVYLWGALVTSAGHEPAYHSFVTWEPLTAEVEAENSLRFWEWLMSERADAHAAGKSFAAYCYFEPAEDRFLKRLGAARGLSEQIDAFIASPEWVDLRKIFHEHLITGVGTGLKTVARIAGFRWDVEDPGGAESMLYYDLALGPPPKQQEAREWLLTYNRGDVEATLAVRHWLQHEAANASSVEFREPLGEELA